MREVAWTDDEGRIWAKLIPDTEPASGADRGITIGPIDVTPLAVRDEWPQTFHVRLHNELYHRRVFPSVDQRGLRARVGDIVAAIQRAAKVDGLKIINLTADDDGAILLGSEQDGTADQSEQGGPNDQ